MNNSATVRDLFLNDLETESFDFTIDADAGTATFNSKQDSVNQYYVDVDFEADLKEGNSLGDGFITENVNELVASVEVVNINFLNHEGEEVAITANTTQLNKFKAFAELEIENYLEETN